MTANRILVVEDNKAISDFIAINLQYTGYEYIVLSDGNEAALYLEQDHSFDLALLDVMIPGMDGFELMDYMKKYNIPVIYLTAKSDVSSKIQGLRGGAEAPIYISIPAKLFSWDFHLHVLFQKCVLHQRPLSQRAHHVKISFDVMTQVSEYGWKKSFSYVGRPGDYAWSERFFQ